MKLVFEKQDDIEVKLKIDGELIDFNYIKFIEYLHCGNELQVTEYSDDISIIEREKINKMITRINESVTILDQE